jgi:hypothetical protein
MKRSYMMSLPTGFWIGHMPWPPLGLRQRLGSTSWEVKALDAVHLMEK